MAASLLRMNENQIQQSQELLASSNLMDYSFRMEDVEEALSNQPAKVFSLVETILATNCSLLSMPSSLNSYSSLKNLDLSSNQITVVPDLITECHTLVNIVLKNNLIEDGGIPKNMSALKSLKELNLSGNLLTRVPDSIIHLSSSLVTLHLGGNRLTCIPPEIGQMRKLQVFYLGGNQLTELPLEIGHLTQLKVFVLCENQLELLPTTVSNLKQLKSLLLHRNRITTLPVELIKLRNLMELSLRDNPLVVQFVRDLTYDPPSLLELAARIVKTKKISYLKEDLPRNLNDYLSTAHHCVNPKCKGVYFDACVEHIKFVDFCGKYRVPLLQYLCSPKCSEPHSSSSAYDTSSDSESGDDRIRKVLLG